MQELVNLSNDATDLEGLLGGDSQRLSQVLSDYQLDGIEFMCCAPWQESGGFPAKSQIIGFHLWFWPTWLDFWQGNQENLLEDFGSRQAVEQYFGASREAWLETYRRNFRQAKLCGAQYAVFHVADARPGEIRTRKFSHTSEQVVGATLEVVNELVGELSEDCPILYENLWWPGMTLQNPKLVQRLLEGTRHRAGIMLDTGHLMNTNWGLRTEEEAAEYVLSVVDSLGGLQESIYGVHLHQSLSGAFAAEQQKLALQENKKMDSRQIMDYVLSVDQHQPFRTRAAARLLEAVEPKVVVHEFVPKDFADWTEKIARQKVALRV